MRKSPFSTIPPISKLFFLGILSVQMLFMFSSLKAQTPAEPDRILKIVRASLATQRINLSGNIRRSGGESEKVQVFLREQNFQFILGTERFHMKIGENSAELFEFDSQQILKPFPKERLNKAIAGSDISFEDFALLFLYWPNPTFEGEDTVVGADCFRLQVNNPNRDGAYKSALIWVHKKYGMFWRIKTFGFNGEPAKQFDIIQIMQMGANKDYGIKTLEVRSLNADGRVKSISKIEFDNPDDKSTPQRAKR